MPEESKGDSMASAWLALLFFGRNWFVGPSECPGGRRAAGVDGNSSLCAAALTVGCRTGELVVEVGIGVEGEACSVETLLPSSVFFVAGFNNMTVHLAKRNNPVFPPEPAVKRRPLYAMSVPARSVVMG